MNTTTKELIARLKLENKDTLLTVIEEIRNSGNAFLLPYLADLFIETHFIEVKDAVLSVFRDIKDKNSREPIMAIIKNDAFKAIRKELITCCWESALDYSAYLADFISFFLKDDYLAAFEAFTVIENFTYPTDKNITIEQISLLKSQIPELAEDRQMLARDLVQILEERSRK